jgi:SAM-dependent methyltransferase
MPMAQLIDMMEAPEPYSPGSLDFWDDDHISAMALRAHLDPHTDDASRQPETIDASVRFIDAAVGGVRGKRILDAGCGPGLYARRLAAMGGDVTGIDISRSSIAYAASEARLLGLDITYRRMDFLHLDYHGEFDLALQIYGEVCALSPPELTRFMEKVHEALRPGGLFIFDVATKKAGAHLSGRSWQAHEAGFWRPSPHLVLEYGADYEEGMLHLDQYAILDAEGAVDICRIWTRCYTKQSVAKMVEGHGFEVVSLHGDLCGAPLKDKGWIGVVARKC